MRFAWVQDLDIMSAAGGAQLTDRAHFIEGIRGGHDLLLYTPQSGLTFPSRLDGIIISNAGSFPAKDIMELHDRGKPVIWFLHDYWPICKYRLFYPMRDSCKSCYLVKRWEPVLKRASLIIWLSSLHRESWLWLCPELKGVPYHLAPSPVDPMEFRDLGIPRSGVIAVESLHEFKGRDHVIQWATDHPEVNITCLGGNPIPRIDLPPNLKDMGSQPNESMNNLYNRHESLLHLPQSPSPFDRTVAEAYLAGCKIIGNELIGALSYSWFKSRDEVANHCQDSSGDFWQAVEEVFS